MKTKNITNEMWCKKHMYAHFIKPKRDAYDPPTPVICAEMAKAWKDYEAQFDFIIRTGKFNKPKDDKGSFSFSVRYEP